MRNLLKVLLVIALPLAAGVGLFAILYALGVNGYFSGILSHDIYESHLVNGLIPFFCVIAFFLGVLPAGVYSVGLLAPVAVSADQQEEEAQEAPAPILLHIGQTFTSVGANCVLRVKALKVTAILDYHNPLMADLM